MSTYISTHNVTITTDRWMISHPQPCRCKAKLALLFFPLRSPDRTSPQWDHQHQAICSKMSSQLTQSLELFCSWHAQPLSVFPAECHLWSLISLVHLALPPRILPGILSRQIFSSFSMLEHRVTNASKWGQESLEDCNTGSKPGWPSSTNCMHCKSRITRPMPRQVTRAFCWL